MRFNNIVQQNLLMHRIPEPFNNDKMIICLQTPKLLKIHLCFGLNEQVKLQCSTPWWDILHTACAWLLQLLQFPSENNLVNVRHHMHQTPFSPKQNYRVEHNVYRAIRWFWKLLAQIAAVKRGHVAHSNTVVNVTTLHCNDRC